MNVLPRRPDMDAVSRERRFQLLLVAAATGAELGDAAEIDRDPQRIHRARDVAQERGIRP